MITTRIILIIIKKKILEHPILVELEASQKHWDNNDDDKKYVKVPTNSRVANKAHKKLRKTWEMGRPEHSRAKIVRTRFLSRPTVVTHLSMAWQCGHFQIKLTTSAQELSNILKDTNLF